MAELVSSTRNMEKAIWLGWCTLSGSSSGVSRQNTKVGNIFAVSPPSGMMKIIDKNMPNMAPTN